MWDNIKRLDSQQNENVSKFVFTTSNAVVESVLYKYPTYEERTVICCSTMSGCPVGCTFCGTGKYFVRNLTAEEIVSQPKYLLDQVASGGTNSEDIKKLQIMFMSMGEPLLNFNNVADAIRILHKSYPQARLLLSSIGPRINYEPVIKLSVEVPTVGLQFSVHESTDEARNKLIPLPTKLSLKDIAAIGGEWHKATGRRPFFNYCANTHNITDQDADNLFALFNPSVWEATISVICESQQDIAGSNNFQQQLAKDFEAKLMERGFSTRVFDPAGQDDIGGGCGQLWYVQDWMKKHPALAKKSCGFSLPVIHAPKGPMTNKVS